MFPYTLFHMPFTVFTPCVADPSWSLYSWFLICYHLPCYYFRPVSYLLPFNTCISPDHLTCHYLARPLCCTMTYPDYYLSLIMSGCLLNITILSCYHFTPSMMYLTCDCHLYGNLDLLSVSWSVTCFPALHAVTWLYSTYVLLNSWSCLFPVFPVKW